MIEFHWNVDGSRLLLCGARYFRRSFLECPPPPKYIRSTSRRRIVSLGGSLTLVIARIPASPSIDSSEFCHSLRPTAVRLGIHIDIAASSGR
jgi:hypothetical protein